MCYERWNSPYPHTIAYSLFSRHFTELNDVYWAHVPSSNKVVKEVKQLIAKGNKEPLKYFVVHDEDDRRVANSFEGWRENYSEFLNYTRLSMLMLLNSCFETYLRTITLLALESKPGIIIHSPNAIDGVFLYKQYFEQKNRSDVYNQYKDIIDDICSGNWTKRIKNYYRIFGNPGIDDKDIAELDKLRLIRNNVGHYFGRKKEKYEQPLFLDFQEADRLSHERLKKYFELVYRVVNQIDDHLKGYIGSFDIIKCYYDNIRANRIKSDSVGGQAKEFQKIIGRANLPPLGTEYTCNLISYCMLDDPNKICRYGKKACVRMIRNRLNERKIVFERDGSINNFSHTHFKIFCKEYCIKGNSNYCERHENKYGYEFFYSQGLIELIINAIVENVGNTVAGYNISLKDTDTTKIQTVK